MKSAITLKMTELVTKTNLLDLNRAAMRDFFVSLGEKPYHGDQLIKWIHQYGITDFSEMTNLSKALRENLSNIAEVRPPEVVLDRVSNDGTRKWLIRVDAKNCVETVFIPEKNRGTLCVSSQVGCALDCSFCATGKQGFNRNLTVAEIIGQLWIATRRLSPDGTSKQHVVSNVVMMGMGEPLLNFDNVLPAMDLMMEDSAYNLSKYRVTLSTSGVLPAMEKLRECSEVSLAVSLHAPNNALRTELVPINKKYPLEKLIPLCKNYYSNTTKRVVTFEYILIDGLNDQKKHARELIRLLADVPCKINLIPYNPIPFSKYKRSKSDVVDAFQSSLQNAGFNVIVRRTRGEDIDAACGQLAGKITDRTPRNARWLRKVQKSSEENHDTTR